MDIKHDTLKTSNSTETAETNKNIGLFSKVEKTEEQVKYLTGKWDTLTDLQLLSKIDEYLNKLSKMDRQNFNYWLMKTRLSGAETELDLRIASMPLSKKSVLAQDWANYKSCRIFAMTDKTHNANCIAAISKIYTELCK